MMIFQVLVKKWWFFQVLTKIDDFSKFGKKWWFFKKKFQKLLFFQILSKNDDFSKYVKKWWFFKFLQKNDDFFKFALLKLFSKTLVSANLLVKWLMLYVAFNVSTYVVCWMFFVGFQCCDICRDIGQSSREDGKIYVVLFY